ALLQGIPGIESESFSGRTALAMATINGARALGLANLIGSLSPGKRADLVTISAKRMLSPLLNPIHSPEEIILRRARREDIRHVLINGQVVMDEGQITTFDPVTVEEELKACCNDIWKESKEREQCLMSTLNEVDPIVENFFRKYDDESLQASSVYNAR
ncbi:MAG: amidohydrolase family protein, partial [Anaerolineaceae bacterium]